MAEVWGWGKERLLGNDAPGKAHRWAFPTLTFCQGHEEWVTQSRCFIHTGWRAGKMNEKGWCPLYSYTSPVTTPLLPIRVPQISALCLHLKTALEVNKKPRFTRFINSTYILEGFHFQRQMGAMPGPQRIGILLVVLCAKPWDEAGALFRCTENYWLGQKNTPNHS